MNIRGFALLLVLPACFAQTERRISQDELKDKIHGYWIGQLVGNYMGFPFENKYEETAIPILIDKYYHYHDAKAKNLRMNTNDRRAYTDIMADALGGAWSDDDTDIELVTLHAVEKCGLDLDYSEITEMWKAHVNRFVWSAASKTRELMGEGLLPPQTGSKEHNEYWYRISSQLMTEIWGTFYPGMTDAAAERCEWNAKIITDDWATHPDIVYGVLYSAAFFEKDTTKLLEIAAAKLPETSPFREGMEKIKQWKSEGKSWRKVRRLLHRAYFKNVNDFEVPYPTSGSIINGLCSILAISYGEGDFVKTIAIATSAGYDCDNQAATCGGLMGIIHGAQAIPGSLTKELPSRREWDTPFNNTYINYSRDGLPNHYRISDIVDRILAVSERAILNNEGSKTEQNGEWIYTIQTDF
ncbi:ADP-ribosylglycohydrolase family protein [Puniceicoccaceae bacterium K14]|nr:ADP-ribosylglycohydrolase family protein [Puniceicoccaceae bacterium K14]